MWAWTRILVLIKLVLGVAAFSIDDFGAIPKNASLQAARINAVAISLALGSANLDSAGDRTVLVPQGNTYFFMPVRAADLRNVTLRVEGDLIASDLIAHWPTLPGRGAPLYADILTFSGCEGVAVRGEGKIHGQGFRWWLRTLLKQDQDQRPHIMYWFQSRDILIENIRFFNSPMYHIKLSDVEGVEIRGISIDVDTTRQTEMLSERGLWNAADKIPIFPLNTDGIDPDGRNIWIHNITVTNFDDVVAVKPSLMTGGKYANCTENVLVEDVRVKYGVGMTVGAVPPRAEGNCVRNVTFRNVEFFRPFKAIYIKTNPGNLGFGMIENVVYENIFIREPIWWAVYIGPQQQHQPDGSGPGCMLFPVDKKCATQPRIRISNVQLRNITSVGNLLPPGIVRCNKKNPCTRFVFKDVHLSGAPYDPLDRGGWYCEHVYGDTYDSFPIPKCFTNQSRDEDSDTDYHKSQALMGYDEHLDAVVSGNTMKAQQMWEGHASKLDAWSRPIGNRLNPNRRPASVVRSMQKLKQHV
mmetsp:Transcript_17902/g.34219  ORF Transcript_17902/g.34219 Transcript_17902/m.34219 type:complete len:525 (-) Transcript_17902:197-1771(-)